MLPLHISQNRHEWNERRVAELQDEIKDQKVKVEKADGFFNKWKEKRILNKMIRRKTRHGEEVIEYELRNWNNTVR